VKHQVKFSEFEGGMLLSSRKIDFDSKSAALDFVDKVLTENGGAVINRFYTARAKYLGESDEVQDTANE